MKYKKIILSLTAVLSIFLLFDVQKASAICIGDCPDEEVISFIDFEGGLDAPSDENLDPTLTRARTAKDFLKNTLNFALTFLGIIALAIVIYGGFLYVTAAGNEEQSAKGKKSITYAVIGILIIIGSFALVNTLLTFGGGSGSDRGVAPGGSGSGGSGAGGGPGGGRSEGSNIGQQAVYNVGAVEINGSINDFMAAYRNLVSVKGFITQMRDLAAPTRGNNRNYIIEVTSIITQIKNNTNPLSKTHVASRRLLETWNAYTQSINLESDDFSSGQLKQRFLEKLDQSQLEQASKDDFEEAVNDIIGPQGITLATNPRGRLNIVRRVLGAIANMPAGERAQNAAQRGIISQQDMERAFAGIDPNITVDQLFDEATSMLNQARTLKDDTDRTDLVVGVQRSLYRLYIIVKDLQFVFVRIRTSLREGNAPLIVELNGLDSRDPTGQSIPETNYKWDPDGDGNDGIAATSASGYAPVECNKTEGSTIACTYKQPGTYQVRLSISSIDPQHVAAGQAFFPITVLPSVARINLKGIVGPISEELRKYERDARNQWNMTIDKTEFQVTTQEASRGGITFDAANSTGGADEPLKMFRWSFGDSSIAEEGQNKTRINNHRYTREGRYPMTLEVTDRGNRKDRKIVNVMVGTLAARVQANATIGEPETTMEFDGSLSRSDNGQISSYNWSVVAADGRDILNSANDLTVVGGTNTSTLRVKFKKPGSYMVRLEVSDGSRSAQTEIPISMRSRRPRANFTMHICPENCADRSQPSLVEFDASSSFDPDPADVLTFDWNFYNEAGDKLEPGVTMTILNNAPMAGQQAKTLRIKFPAIGKYKAVLRVNDSHQDQNIRQEDSREREFEIKSNVEANWTGTSTSVARMTNGRASFTFSGSARNANRVMIDFGDSQSDEQQIESLTGPDGRFSFQHEYTKAGSYLATARIMSDSNGENVLLRRVNVASGDNPFAVINVFVDNQEFVLPEPTPDDPSPYLEIIRNRPVRFDAAQSIASNGETSGLRYSWDFGDNRRSTGARTQHSYQEVSPEDSVFTVTLTASEENDPSKINQATFPIKINSIRPTVNTLSMEKRTSGNLTPIEVELTAEGASDTDGRITNYQFWYYDPANKDVKLSVVDTQTNRATLTVETAGAANEQHTYYFCMSVTDNENATATCEELFEEDDLPRLQVTNGPNQAPNAAFAADRTNVRVNELVTFTSSSTDTDGQITQYIWDFDGDGFQNDNPTQESTATHRYERRSPSQGYRAKLKVIDNQNAAGFSREIPIHVSALSNPPTANFTFQVQTNPVRRVRFFDSSTADTMNGARLTRWIWDFDTSSEMGCSNPDSRPSYCNGNATDDKDSTDQNPIFDFPASGTFQVKLRVIDNNGTESEPRTTLVNVSTPGSAGGSGNTTPVSNALNAELSSHPTTRFETIRGQQMKAIHVPATSNGEDVTLFWGDSTGDVVSYRIDKNIWCDSDGDGYPNNDIDAVHPDASHPETSGRCTDVTTGAPAENCWRTNYQRFSRTRPNDPPLAGHFRTLLTVTDRDQNIATDTIDVIFDGQTDPANMQKDGCEYNAQSALGGSVFKNLGMQNTILISLAAGIAAVLGGFAVASLFRRGKRRVV